MSATIAINTGHEDMIHDAAFDFYGKRVATASSDRVIRVFDVDSVTSVSSSSTASTTATSSSASSAAAIPTSPSSAATPAKSAELRRHEGPVWQVAWAHPKFGSLLASCSYDRRVIIWREEGLGQWAPVHEYTGHTLSVNSVAWAPPEYGLVLACASSDGAVSVLTWREDERWDSEKILVDAAGVNAVSWAPALAPASILKAPSAGAPGAVLQLAPRRFAAACCDGTVRVFEQQQQDQKWACRNVLRAHVDWVRDVAWAPSIGLPVSSLASCSQDGIVIIWSQQGGPEAEWRQQATLPKFADAVWRLSWSVAGNTLAVACGDSKVTLWKESVDGEWKCVSSLDEPAETAPPS